MIEHPPTMPHFLGLLLAIAGVVFLLVLLTRQKIKKRLGRFRLFVALASLIGLTLLALFGSGVLATYSHHVIYDSFLINNYPSERLLSAAESAFQTATSDEFIEQWLSKNQPRLDFTAKDLRQTLTLRRRTYEEMRQQGFDIYPQPPSQNTEFLSIDYYDAANFGLRFFGIGEKEAWSRFYFAQELGGQILQALALAELLRTSQDDAEKQKTLRLIKGLPSCRNTWILKDLQSIRAKQVSPEIQAAFDDTISYVSQQIEQQSISLAKEPAAK